MEADVTPAEKERLYRSTRREKYAAYQRAYYQRNKEKVSAYDRMRKVRDAEKIRARDIKKKYGMTPEVFDALHSSQQGACAICRNPLTTENRGTVVDHCHDTGKVRGLLCQGCNRGIGLLKDDATVLASAIEYLTKHRKAG
jgi:hypothetical protein